MKMRALAAAGLLCYPVRVAEGLAEDEAHALEIELIAKYGRADLGKGPLLNLTNGGPGSEGLKHTTDAQARMSAAAKRPRGVRRAPFVTEATRAKLSSGWRPLSLEARAKISETLRGRPRTPESVAKQRATCAARSSGSSSYTRPSQPQSFDEPD
jgi:hypothetical protein